MFAFWQSRRVGFTVALVALLVDQVSKQLALVKLGALSHMLIPDFLGLRLTFNKGMSFSFLADADAITIAGVTLAAEQWLPLFFATLAAVAILGFSFWLGSSRTWWHQWGLGLVIGGAAGNMIDRFLHGAVVDFLDFYLFGQPMWIFNLADAAITVGVALLLLESLRFGAK